MSIQDAHKQISKWTLAGPFFAKPGQGNWFKTPLDGMSQLPANVKINGKQVPVKRVTARNGLLDFEKLFRVTTDKSKCGIRHQVVAFTTLTVKADSTLVLRYDADWYAVWWVDGNEVYSSRNGNVNEFGTARHRVVVPLTAGKHVIAVRVICTNRNWKLSCSIEGLTPGIADEFRTDRGARWRDYTSAVVRFEHRPPPDRVQRDITTEQHLRFMRNLGVNAHWLSVVNQHNGAYYKSRYIGRCDIATDEFDRLLKEWVDGIHENRMSAMSWYGLVVCKPIWEKHPEWRQKFITENVELHELSKYACCINSPYGDLVIKFTIEALKKFDLDGFWYDGSFFSPCWVSTGAISCVCDYCRAAFKRDTGMDLPERYDWSLPEFRRWVSWRYDMYSAYWQRLVDAVHEEVPEATIVFNHYHREDIGWNGAIPLKPFGHDFVSGTEADSEPLRAMFYTRLMKAFGRRHTEVWMGMDGVHKAIAHAKQRVLNPRNIMEFALACSTAGGHCSFGGFDYNVANMFMGDVVRELKMREPFVDLPPVPQVALHVSQQTETFVFGRNPSFITSEFRDYYWNSMTGWHHLLAYSGASPEVLFDDHLKASVLRKYPVLVMPLAVAMTARQYRTIIDYVSAGGILLTGPWFALSDAEGEPSPQHPLGDRDLFPFGGEFPGWDDIKARSCVTFCGRDKGGELRFGSNPLHSLGLETGKVSLDRITGNSAISIKKLGKGHVVQFGFDPGTLFRYSESKCVVDFLENLLTEKLEHRRLVEIPGHDEFLLGIFSKGKRTTVVHILQFTPPWRREDITVKEPPMCWDVDLVWNGPKPRSIRCMLPEEGPVLKPIGKGQSWQARLPPFRWGQVVVVET